MSRDFTDAKQHEQFLERTSSRMAADAVEARFRVLKGKIEGFLQTPASSTKVLETGCGVGVLSRLWARDGYDVTGIDLDPGLVALADSQTRKEGISANFKVSSAEHLTFAESSFDVVLSLEMLEHVDDWRACLDEAHRVLKPGGLFVLTTSNVISPLQDEYRLPLFSWWPAWLKHKVYLLARDRWPALARYSPCPAQHWFSYFGLKKEFENRGFKVFDRIDVISTAHRSMPERLLVQLARTWRPVRFLAYLGFRGTIVYALKAHGHESPV